jgi:hypothetical protein
MNNAVDRTMEEMTNTVNRTQDDLAFINSNPGFVPEEELGDESVVVTNSEAVTTNTTSALTIDLNGLKDLQASLITTTMEALQKKKARRLEPHLEDALLKSLGVYPARGKGLELIKWVIKMDTLCNTYTKDIEPKETLKILFRTIHCPDITNQLGVAFGNSAGVSFVRPQAWKDEWPFPLTGTEERIHVWVARFLLAQGCPRDVMVNFVRNLAPSRQMDKEDYLNLVQRLQALKSISLRCRELFPGKFEMYRVDMYDHFLVNELEPKLAKKVSEYLEIENKTEAKIRSIMMANNIPLPPTPEPNPHEMAQVIRKVAATMKSQESDSDEETKKGSYTSTLPANVNFVMYDGKNDSTKKKNDEAGKKELKEQLDKYKQELDELGKRLTQQQHDLRFNTIPPPLYYPQQAYFANANHTPIGTRPQLPQNTTQSNNGMECSRCHNYGHDANNCRMRSQSRVFVHRAHGNGNGERTPFAPYSNVKMCYNCNAPGHFSKDCTLPPRRPCKYCGGNHFDQRCKQYVRPGKTSTPNSEKRPSEQNVQFTVNIPMDEPAANRITELE